MNIKVITLFIFWVFFSSCEEEIRGPLRTDGIPPGIVTEISVTSIPGGAHIEYTLPADEDIQLVRAEYTLSGGEAALVRSSLFNNFLEVRGLVDSLNDHSVTLYVEDKSGNQSDPVMLDFRILPAPVFTAAKSVRMIPDFGGVRLFWSNPGEQFVSLRLFTQGEKNEPIDLAIESKDTHEEDTLIVRGFEPIERDFKVLVFDRFGNWSDSIIATLTPIKEVEIPKKDFKDIFLPGDITEAPAFIGNKSGLWDGATDGPRQWLSLDNGGQGRVEDPVDEYDPALGNPESHIMSIDLGRSIKCSRFIYHQGEAPQAYAFGGVRRFDLWVTNETPDPNGSLEGWTKVLDNAQVIRPSGLSRSEPLTQEDIAQRDAGHEFTLPLETQNFRYVRFAFLENWLGTIVFSANEFTFFGDFE